MPLGKWKTAGEFRSVLSLIFTDDPKFFACFGFFTEQGVFFTERWCKMGVDIVSEL